jgi:hypothetical protein
MKVCLFIVVLSTADCIVAAAATDPKLKSINDLDL